jgi:glycerophosphoryl diester phosphodiesterase
MRELTKGRKPGELTAEQRRQLIEINRQHPWQFDEKKLEAAVSALTEVNDERLERTIVFSSFADLEKHIDRLPKKITGIAYNTEAGMTPVEENEDVATFVQKFADLAHKKGFRASWGPSLDYFDRMEQRGTLGKAIAQVDQVGLQLQRVLQQGGITRLKQFTEEKVALIHKYKPEAKITAQLVLGRQDAQQSIEGFKAILGQADYLAVFTLNDAEGTKKVIEGVRAK